MADIFIYSGMYTLVAGQLVAIIAFTKAAILKKKLNNYREALKAVSTLLKIAGALTIVGFIVTGTGITIGLKN